MIGSLNLPLNKSGAKTYVFTANDIATVTSNVLQSGGHIWQKPTGINFVYGLLIGPGSGGGGGGTLGGGGGGTPGSYMQFLQPAILVPDILSITIGRGGIGGNGGNPSGANGGLPLTGTTLGHVIQNSKYGLGTGQTYYAYPGSVQTGTQSGRGGTNLAAGNGGTATTAPLTNFHTGIYGIAATVQSVGTWNFATTALATSPSTGFNGGLITAGTDATFLGRPQGGAGGGGRSGGAKAGGNVVQPTGGPFENIGKRFGGAANGSKGNDGVTLFSPTLFFTPGAGGGANDAGTGGAGGNGGIGCGGGGGGAGSTGGGAGGAGGDGLVILVCW
jgi:hypothetical protein